MVAERRVCLSNPLSVVPKPGSISGNSHPRLALCIRYINRTLDSPVIGVSRLAGLALAAHPSLKHRENSSELFTTPGEVKIQ